LSVQQNLAAAFYVGDSILDRRERVGCRHRDIELPGGDQRCRLVENSRDLRIILRAYLIEAMKSNIFIHQRPEVAGRVVTTHEGVTNENDALYLGG
jgi:hypothetical protein